MAETPREAHRTVITAAPSLWRNPDYVLLWAGQTISMAGSNVSGLAFPLLVLALTHSPAQAGIVEALAAVPYVVLSLPAGALVDRWNRKRTMIVCDLGRAVALGSIPLAMWFGYLSIIQLYIVAVVGGVLFVFFDLASTAALPRLVSGRHLTAAIAQGQASAYTAGLLGPPLGGFLYQVQSAVPFAVDALSYGASVAGLLFIKTRFQPDGHAKREPLRTEIREGVAWLWNHHLFRDMALLTAAINVVMSTSGLILIIIARNQHASPWMIGALFAAAGVGGIIGSAMAPLVSKRLSFGQAIIGTLWLQTVIWPLFALAPNSVVLGLVNAALAFVGPTFNVVLVSYRLAHTPDPLQGRVNSAVRVMTFGGPPLGLALSGVLLQTVGAHPTVWIFAACLLLLAMAASLNPRVRKAQLLAPRPSA